MEIANKQTPCGKSSHVLLSSTFYVYPGFRLPCCTWYHVRSQTWSRGEHLPPGNVVVFCALAVTVKRSVFHNFLDGRSGSFSSFWPVYWGRRLKIGRQLFLRKKYTPREIPGICAPLENMLRVHMHGICWIVSYQCLCFAILHRWDLVKSSVCECRYKYSTWAR